jgi:release factor glutamine methyltransferase
LRAAATRLAATGVDTPDLDARLLALEAFGLTLAALVAEGDAEASGPERARLEGLVERRLAGEPVDRILGRREFWGLDFALSPETLAPRPDSETVVEAALAEIGRPDRALAILDLGTGTGCLLLALLSELRSAWGIGIDRSPGAAAAARRNAEALGLGARARFVVGDWAAALDGSVDVLVSNPPYVASAEIGRLDAAVRDHDPRLALDGGDDGLDAYRAILADAPRLLAPGGVAVLELGAGQRPAVSALAIRSGLSVVRAVPDLAGLDRAITLRPAARDHR